MFLRKNTRMRMYMPVLSVLLLFSTSFSAVFEDTSCHHEHAHDLTSRQCARTCPEDHLSEECTCDKAPAHSVDQYQFISSESPRIKIQHVITTVAGSPRNHTCHPDLFPFPDLRGKHATTQLPLHISSTILRI